MGEAESGAPAKKWSGPEVKGVPGRRVPDRDEENQNNDESVEVL